MQNTSAAKASEPPRLSALRDKLAELRTEFVDLAFALERRGRFDAADVALTASARVGEICEEFEPDAEFNRLSR